MKRPEQIEGDMWLLCEHPWRREERQAVRRRKPSAYRRHLKRLGRRVMRREGRELLDEAPRRPSYCGYEY
jgi:hypothetical protein